MRLTWCVVAIFHGFSAAFDLQLGSASAGVAHGFDLWFVYVVDINRERDGKEDRVGKMTRRGERGIYCLQKDRPFGQLAFLLNPAIRSPFLCVMQVRRSKTSDAMGRAGAVLTRW
jgi:hypothetical protein